MKTLITLFTFILLTNSFSQETQPVIKKNVNLRAEKIERTEVKRIKLPSTATSVLGLFEIVDYTVYGNKKPSKKDLNLLIGTKVKVQESNLTGNEIDPISFKIFEIEKMASTDYIYRVFGRNIHQAETSLPLKVNVHKTTHEDCYGIIDLGNGEIAVPYKGVLLYLKKIKSDHQL